MLLAAAEGNHCPIARHSEIAVMVDRQMPLQAGFFQRARAEMQRIPAWGPPSGPTSLPGALRPGRLLSLAGAKHEPGYVQRAVVEKDAHRLVERSGSIQRLRNCYLSLFPPRTPRR